MAQPLYGLDVLRSAGRLDRRFRVERDQGAIDAAGTHVPDWRFVARRWGAIYPLRSDEIEVAAMIEARASHRVVFEVVDGLRTGDRLIDEKTNKVYHITGALRPGDQRGHDAVMVIEDQD